MPPQNIEFDSELLNYLVERAGSPGARLPTIDDLSRTLGISTSKLREQLEVARTLGLVDVRPKTGIRVQEFSLLPCLRTSVRFALAVDPANFEFYGVLRNHLEVSFWHEAVRALLPEDKAYLKELVARAWDQLNGEPVQIPQLEHRELHMTIYSRLNNPFVQALLEAYWEAYELVGLNVYTDYSYLQKVWKYHEQMVEAILQGDEESGYRHLIEHIGILQHRPEMDQFRPGMKPRMDRVDATTS